MWAQSWTIEDKHPKTPFESPPLDFPNLLPLSRLEFESSGGSHCEGHNPPGGHLPLRRVLRGLCGVLFVASAGLCGVLRGSTGFSEGSDNMLVTLVNSGEQLETGKEPCMALLRF